MARLAAETIHVEKDGLLALRERTRTFPKPARSTSLLGTVVHFPIADGYAWYIVVNVRPLTLAHIHLAGDDGYEIPYAHMRGLRASDIRRMADSDRFWRNLTGAPSINT